MLGNSIADVVHIVSQRTIENPLSHVDKTSTSRSWNYGNIPGCQAVSAATVICTAVSTSTGIRTAVCSERAVASLGFGCTAAAAVISGCPIRVSFSQQCIEIDGISAGDHAAALHLDRGNSAGAGVSAVVFRTEAGLTGAGCGEGCERHCECHHGGNCESSHNLFFHGI